MPRSQLLSTILLPLSKLYGAGVWVRNKMFDWNILKSHKFNIPVIAVGNIAVGGTGKTPHTEYIVNILRNSYHVGVLSRGYKRETKGFIMATPHSTPRDIGDESYQIYHKFKGKVAVAVSENRVKGITRMLEIDPAINVIVLDDALQHRHVKPQVTIVLTEYDRPVFSDSLLPYGRLRESKAALRRADMVIVTKCPDDIKPIEFNIFDKNLNLIPDQQRFYSRFRYPALRPAFPDAATSVPELNRLTVNDSLLTVCGIGNPKPFVRYIKSFLPKVKVNVFSDHHNYSRKDIDLIESRFDSLKGSRRYIITTEKDAVRLVNNPYFPHRLKPYIFYLPVQVEFVNDPSIKPYWRFDDVLLRHINNART